MNAYLQCSPCPQILHNRYRKEMTARSLVSAESSCIPANSLNVLRLFSDGGMGEPAAARTRTGSVISDSSQGTGVCVFVRLCVCVCVCVCVCA